MILLFTLLFFTACSEDIEPEVKVDTTEGTFTRASNQCAEDFLASSDLINNCVVCHNEESDGFTSFDLRFNDSGFNYISLSSYFRTKSDSDRLLAKIDADNLMPHGGGKAEAEILEFFVKFVDIYAHPESCSTAGVFDSSQNIETPEENSTLDGAELYAQQCASCHGANGTEGLSFAGDYFKEDSDYPTHRSLVAYVSETMPPNSASSCDDACSEAIYDYALENFPNVTLNNTDVETNTTTSIENNETDENNETLISLSGAEHYGQKCAHCHGSNGEGGLGGAYFVLDSEFDSTALLASKIRDTMPPLDHGSCDQECSDKIAAYAESNFERPVVDGSGGTTIPETNTSTGTETNTTVVLDGAKLYSAQCAFCHGSDGIGVDGNPDFFSKVSSKEILVKYIADSMPTYNASACDQECSDAIYTYAVENFDNPYQQEENATLCDDSSSVSPKYLRLLDRQEYTNTLKDLFGFSSSATDALPSDKVFSNYKNSVDASIANASKMESYLNVAIAISDLVVDEHLDTVYSCGLVEDNSSVDVGSGTTTCSAPAYVAGSTYAANDVVSYNGKEYQCIYNTWCSDDSAAGLAAWELGVGSAYENTWTLQGTCSSASPALRALPSNEDACVDNFVADFTKKVYRKPVSGADLSTLSSMIKTADTTTEGLKDYFTTILISPNFLYRSEVGSDTGFGYALLNDYEVASALSYLLWGSMPDQELFDLADAGSLHTAAQIKAQATRMVETSAAKDQIARFSGLWLHTEEDAIGPKSSAEFNALGVKSSLAAEFAQIVKYAVYEGSGTFSEMMDAEYFFANDTLSTFYSLDTSLSGSAMQKQSKRTEFGTTSRGGLLRTGAFLASHGQFDESGALSRGSFIRREILCHDLPFAPVSTEAVNTSPPEPDETVTTRELFDVHTSPSRCYACHMSFNDIGYAFENYEGDGRYREKEMKGTEQSPLFLDITTAGVLEGIKSRFDGAEIPYSSRDDLIETLATQQQTKECYATQYFRFSKGYMEADMDSCSLDNLKARFVESGGNIKTLMIEMTQLNAFTHREN